jgi:hypothetical protein
MTRVQNMTRRDLERLRKRILADIGMSYEDLAARAATRSLVGDEWAAWEEIREIEFLRNG